MISKWLPMPVFLFVFHCRHVQQSGMLVRCTLDAGVVPMQSRKPFTIKAEPCGQCCPPYVFAVFAKVNANLAVKALRTLHAIPILDNGGSNTKRCCHSRMITVILSHLSCSHHSRDHDVHVKCHRSGACVGNMRYRRCTPRVLSSTLGRTVCGH